MIGGKIPKVQPILLVHDLGTRIFHQLKLREITNSKDIERKLTIISIFKLYLLNMDDFGRIWRKLKEILKGEIKNTVSSKSFRKKEEVSVYCPSPSSIAFRHKPPYLKGPKSPLFGPNS